MTDNEHILSDRNIAAFIATDAPEAQRAAEDLARMVADPVIIWGVLKKLNITTELMLSVLKSIATDPGASASGRISAIREIRAIARSAGLSWGRLTKHYKLEEAVADLVMKKRLAETAAHPPQDDEESRRIKALLNEPIRLNGF